MTAGGSFWIGSTAINGSLQIQNIPASSAQSEICGTDVRGNLQITNNNTAVAIGTASASCSGDRIGGNLQVNNNGSVEVADDAAGDDLQCRGNSSITGSGDIARLLQGQCADF
jgi:hypothetical protein